MEVCFITPTPMLEEYATKSKHHLILAHIYEQDVDYRSFYQQRVKEGDFVILDNSAYELGKSYDIDRLLNIAEELQPAAMFLPDSRFETEETLQLVAQTIRSIKLRPKIQCDLWAVPQGSNFGEILQCYAELMTMPEIKGFGLYEEIGRVSGFKNRRDFLETLQNMKIVHPEHYYYHLLGMEDSVNDLQELSRFNWVSSIDSVKPICYGLYGIVFDPQLGPLAEYPHRPKDYFTRYPAWFREIIHLNCELTMKWAQATAPFANGAV